MTHDDLEREAILYVPESWSPDAPTLVLLNFHGYGGTMADQMEEADFRPIAEEEGFVGVVPQGLLLENLS